MIENQGIKLKLNWKEDFLNNVSAFSNSEGGIIYLGINDKGEAVGVENTEKLLETLPNINNQKTGISPVLEIESINQKQIIKITIQASSVQISYNGRYFVRSGSAVIELNKRELSDFLLGKNGATWDGLETNLNWAFETDIATFEYFKKLASDRLPFTKDENDVQLLVKNSTYLPSHYC